MFGDFENYTTENFSKKTFKNSDLNDLSSPLAEIEEPENFEDDITENLYTKEITENDLKTLKKRFVRLNKLGAKGIVKMLDVGNANLCRKISYSESALEYRADSEAIEDLAEVIEEIIPKKPGKELKIPLWLQLLIFTLLAFLPTLIAAIGDRTENIELKEQKEELKKLKKEKKVIKKKLEKMKLEKELIEAVNKEPEDEKEVNILNGNGDNIDSEIDKEKNN